jgi:hypothetical protein
MDIIFLILSILLIAEIVINKITNVIDSLDKLRVSIQKLKKNHSNTTKSDSSKSK